MENNNTSVLPLVKSFPKSDRKQNLIYMGVALLIVLAGVLTGWKLSGSGGGLGQLVKGDSDNVVVPGSKVSENEAGIADETTFSDTADGTLEEGGLSGEGTHHLVRGGDESKYVVLTSTVIDLDTFVGKKVTVWGQSLSSQKATWLMDVGKLRVIE